MLNTTPENDRLMRDSRLGCPSSETPFAPAVANRAVPGTGLTLAVKIAIFTVKKIGKDE